MPIKPFISKCLPPRNADGVGPDPRRCGVSPGLSLIYMSVMVTVLVSPPVAKSLSAAGYSKQDVKRYLYENATMPLAEFEWIVKYTMIERTTVRARVEAGILPREFLGKPDERVRVLSSPDIVHIVVCGDPHRNRIMVLEGGHTRPTTRLIRGPAPRREL